MREHIVRIANKTTILLLGCLSAFAAQAQMLGPRQVDALPASAPTAVVETSPRFQ